MNYAYLVAGVSALHNINQEPQITLVRATFDLNWCKQALAYLNYREFSRVPRQAFSNVSSLALNRIRIRNRVRKY